MHFEDLFKKKYSLNSVNFNKKLFKYLSSLLLKKEIYLPGQFLFFYS